MKKPRIGMMVYESKFDAKGNVISHRKFWVGATQTAWRDDDSDSKTSPAKTARKAKSRKMRTRKPAGPRTRRSRT